MIASHPYGQSFTELLRLEPSGEDAFVLRLPFAWGGTTPAADAIAWQEAEAAPPSAPEATPSLFDLRPATETWRDVLDWRPIGPPRQYRRLT